MLEMNYTQNLTEIEFNTTSGEFGPITIFNWEGAIRIIWIILFGFSALVTFGANIIPIHFIAKMPSETRRPIDTLLLYDQVSFFIQSLDILSESFHLFTILFRHCQGAQ